MNMNARTKGFSRVWLAFGCMMLMSGCYGIVRFYPVQGPLMMQTPVPVSRAKITGGAGSIFGVAMSGNITVTLQNGEVCKGRWELVTTPPESPLQLEWDSIYGKGFYVSHVLGSDDYAQATLRGSGGTVLNAEMYSAETLEPSGKREQSPLQGVAKDNHGNIFKIAAF